MSRIAVTGATGFIGRTLCNCLRDLGHEPIALARRGGEPWKLGEKLPDTCFEADAVVHLASATLGDATRVEEAVAIDVEGTRLIVTQLRAWRRYGGKHRLVFLSSQSARSNAANAYGRSKWLIETMLDQPDEIVVRPGLVYGDPPASVYATFDRIARLPLVPIVDAKKGIQPIGVEELAECLVRIAIMDASPPLLQLGAIEPLTLAEALQAAARRAGRRRPLTVSLPASLVRLATQTLDRVFGMTLTERIDGLLSLEPFDTRDSLALLNRSLQPFAPAERSAGQTESMRHAARAR